MRCSPAVVSNGDTLRHRVEIVDSGYGVPDVLQPKLFEKPFTINEKELIAIMEELNRKGSGNSMRAPFSVISSQSPGLGLFNVK